MGLLRWGVAVVALGACLSACAADAVVVGRAPPPDPVATVTSDMLWGGLAGGAVSGLVIGYQMGLQNQHGYDWVPVLVTGVGIGLAGGLVLGIAEALSRPGEDPLRPAHDGMSLRETRTADLSGQVTLPLWAGRF